MKKTVGVILAGFFLLFSIIPVTVFAAEKTKTAVVNYTTIINNSEPGKAANAELAALAEDKRLTVEKQQKDLDNLKKEFEAQAATLTSDEKKIKQQQFEKALNEFRQSVGDANTAIERRRNELRQQVIKEIKNIITKIAQEQDFAMIFDAELTPFYLPDKDITAEVILRYNAFKNK